VRGSRIGFTGTMNHPAASEDETPVNGLSFQESAPRLPMKTIAGK